MIGDLLRRLHIRYFRPASTPASPEIDRTAEAERAILEALKASGLIPAHAQVRMIHATPPVAPGIKPPPDPAIDGMTWRQWENELVVNGVIPGWSFCRFGQRTGKTGEKAAFVFGHVRGGFGVWQQRFDVCTDEGSGPDLLTCLTHLRTGAGIGVFAEHQVAIEAAELAERVCPDWHAEPEIKPEPYQRALQAWQGAGIRPATNAHAHDSHGNVFELIGRSPESVMEGKPEKLS